MINCIALDDEPLALDLLEDNIRKVPFLNLVKKCNNSIEASELMAKEKIDLIFLDIEMPNISGISFLKSLKYKPMVIFITAYEKYAIEGFELDVLDYLLKPVSFDRFFKSANKALEYYSYITAPEPNIAKTSKFIFVKADYKIIKINFSEILYIEGLKDYIKIYAGKNPILTLSSMKVIEDKLPSSDFIRVHKSFIVSIQKIESISKSRIHIGDKEIPVSDSYREEFFKVIENNNLS
jgi:DNA-binding LytR/AlgR family response regulator